MGRLVVKADHSIEILGTLDLVPCRAEVAGATRLPDGTLDLEWAGGSEVFWDDQRTVQRQGQDVYLDENGNEYLESEIDVIEDGEEEANGR